MASITRTFPMALLVVLVFVGSASAECAWVLWVHSIDRQLLKPESYHVERAHPTRPACVEEIPTFAALLKKEGYTIRAAGGPEAIGETRAERIRYFCLPDTVDPRGPKGR